MTIYSFHLFDRNCDPSITHHFHRPAHTLESLDLSKLIFGVTFSLTSTIRKLSLVQEDDFYSFRTSGYAMHVLTTASNLRFILVTSPDVPPSASDRILRQIYAGLYVEYILKNPLGLATLYRASSLDALKEYRFGKESAQSKAGKRRQAEMMKREAGEEGDGWARDVGMVMGCELFILALEQFVQGLPGYN